tara:strand:- start:245 stop:487 length:243 start_codon:yes stop_codon:yes gene_type:complete
LEELFINAMNSVGPKINKDIIHPKIIPDSKNNISEYFFWNINKKHITIKVAFKNIPLSRLHNKDRILKLPIIKKLSFKKV